MKNLKRNLINDSFNLSECINRIGQVKIKTLIVMNKKKKY